MSDLRINRIEIIDTYGCEHFSVGQFSAIRIHGPNGAGKSSILRSLSYLFDGGTDPSVIRRWKNDAGEWVEADKSSVSIWLTDGTTISKTTRPKRGRRGGDPTGYTIDLEVTQPDGQPRKAPQTYINELAELNTTDPTILLRIDASTVPGRQKLAAELMRLVPISFTVEALADAYKYLPAGAKLDLDGLKKISAAITEERRRVGQTRDTAGAAVDQLRKSLPESSLPLIDRYSASQVSEQEESAAKVALEESEEYRREVEAAITDRKAEIEKEKTTSLLSLKDEHKAAQDTINADIDAKIKVLQDERLARLSKANEINNYEASKISAIAQSAYSDLDAQSQPELEKAISNVTSAKELVKAQAKASAIREIIEGHEKEAREAAIRYDQLSNELKRLEQLRLDKLKNLPVAGLVVEDGIPYLDGIEWKNVNLERRVEAILEICTQGGGKLPLILFDDSEHCDHENRKYIEDGLIAAGYQLIRAEVSEAERLMIEVK